MKKVNEEKIMNKKSKGFSAPVIVVGVAAAILVITLIFTFAMKFKDTQDTMMQGQIQIEQSFERC